MVGAPGRADPPGTPLPEQARRYVLEAVHDPDGPRLLAWNGLQYDGAGTGPDAQHRSDELRIGVDELRRSQADGDLPADVDPEILLVILMAAAMAPTTLPHVIAGLTGEDPRSPQFVERFADQLATFVGGLAKRGPAGPAS
ncbi:hypothetical protein [Tsukamurella soli]|uniref:hypothetical protein n=1 Tax=Tsukamurella soli TaxID=644556 RepID=UPI00360F8B58